MGQKLTNSSKIYFIQNTFQYYLKDSNKSQSILIGRDGQDKLHSWKTIKNSFPGQLPEYLIRYTILTCTKMLIEAEIKLGKQIPLLPFNIYMYSKCTLSFNID